MSLRHPRGRTVDTCPLVRFMTRCVSAGACTSCALCTMVDWDSETTRAWVAAWRPDDDIPVPRKRRETPPQAPARAPGAMVPVRRRARPPAA